MPANLRVIGLATLLALLFVQPVYADAFLESTSSRMYGDFVEGRPINTSFTYEITKTHEPIDTALVIDESGSMSGVIGDAKDGAKQYVDSTLTSEGDENAVVEFESSASTIQSLTSSKSAAKDAIDTINDGGGTDLPAGVSEGHDALDSGSNDLQVMIVLADGGGGDPGYEADQARADGIEVHGIMYGSGASTSEFESMTNADTCTTDSNENDDRDKCWYAEGDTIDKVYQSIQEDIAPDSSAELHVRVPDYAKSFDHSVDNDLSGNTKEYVIEGQVKEGVLKRNFTWYPTENGTNMMVKPGTSYIEVEEGGSTSQMDFTQYNETHINYTDYYIEENSLVRKDGVVNISLRVGNDGNVDTIKNEVGVYDEEGNNRVADLAPLSPGEEVWKNFTISPNKDVVDNPSGGYLRAKADYEGIWNTVPERAGSVGEQDETNNAVNLGFPPEITDFSPDSIIFFDNPFKTNYTIQHPEPASVQGDYNKTVTDSNFQSGSLSKPEDNILQTDPLDIDLVERYYNMTINITGPNNARTIYNHSYFVDNPTPNITSFFPSDGGVSINSPVELELSVLDANNDEVDIRFYDVDDGDLIEERTDVANDTTVLQPWEVETIGEDYRWRVEVEDQYDTTDSPIWEFTKVVGASYRVQTEVETDYSTVITSVDSTRDIFFTARNRVPFERNLVTEVSGAGATIDGSKQKEYSLGDGQSERFAINLNPQEDGKQTLYINTTNTNTSTKIVDKVPVMVKDYQTVSPEAVELPGIGLLHLLMLYLAGVFTYYLRL